MSNPDSKPAVIIDLLYTYVFVVFSPIVAAFGMANIRGDGDLLTKLSGWGLTGCAILLFGFACIGLRRLRQQEHSCDHSS